MIKITKIFLEGFGSWVEPTTLEFKSPNGMLSISGLNGSGKSTLLNAISFTLFGQSFKSKSRIQSYDHLLKRGTCTGVTFIKGNSTYEVYRCISYGGKVNGIKGGDSLFVFINGEVPKQAGKGKKMVQEYIESVLGYSFTLFRNVVFFGQRAKRFVEESNSDKKAIFEQMFSLEIFNQAKEESSRKLSTVNSDITEKTSEYNLMVNRLSNLRERVSSGEEIVNNSEKIRSEYSEMLAEYNSELDSLNRKRGKLLKGGSLKHQKGKVEKELNDINSRLGIKRSELKLLSSELSGAKALIKSREQLKSNLGLSLDKGVCQYCNSTGVDKSHIKSEISKLNKSLLVSNEDVNGRLVPKVNSLEIEIETIQLELKSKQEELVNYKNKEELLESTQTSINFQSKNIAKVDKLLRDLDGEVEKARGIILSSKLKIKKINPQLKSLSKDISQLEKQKAMYKWFNDVPLSNRGIKNYVFNMLVGNVNRFLLQYEKFTGIQVEIVIDNESYNKDIHILISKGGHTVFYEDLSGGEMQLANISLLMAMNDVLTSVNPINILVLDEVFESLDPNNIEVVYNILLEKSQKIMVILVSHIPEIISQYTMERILLKSINDISSVLSK